LVINLKSLVDLSSELSHIKSYSFKALYLNPLFLLLYNCLDSCLSLFRTYLPIANVHADGQSAVSELQNRFMIDNGKVQWL